MPHDSEKDLSGGVRPARFPVPFYRNWKVLLGAVLLVIVGTLLYVVL